MFENAVGITGKRIQGHSSSPMHGEGGQMHKAERNTNSWNTVRDVKVDDNFKSQALFMHSA